MKSLLLFALTLLTLAACNLSQEPRVYAEPIAYQASATATETIPPYTPLATLTASPTLRPPPTFEPPTHTPQPSLTPSVTPTATLNLSVSIPGLHGAETPTPTSTAGCQPRKDWKLRYTVQRDDALSKIASRYQTTVNELVQANCLSDANLIRIGQELRVPGAAQPATVVECAAWEALTPMDGSMSVPGDGALTFNWRGPLAARNLIRIIKPDGGIVEIVVELRQNETIDLYEKIPHAGTYRWYVFPLDANFAQLPCKEGGPWTFTKAEAPTPTPTMNAPNL